MARTLSGILLNERFFRRDMRDIIKFRRLVKLQKAGLLTKRAERTLRRLRHTHLFRYGKPLKPITRADIEESKALKKDLWNVDAEMKKLGEEIARLGGLTGWANGIATTAAKDGNTRRSKVGNLRKGRKAAVGV